MAKRTPMYRWYQVWRGRRAYRQWLAGGKPIPPPHEAKQAVIRSYQQRYALPIMVETGTYQGDMVAAMRDAFQRIVTIELSVDLHRKAQGRFAADRGVSLLQGDSGEVIGRLLADLDAGTLFWLDGHWSDGVTAKGSSNTPVMAELRHVLGFQRPFVILIDDARCFTGRDDYPTVAEIEALVRERRPDLRVTVDDDIIRVEPSVSGH